MSSTVLEVNGLSAFYGVTQALFGVDFCVEEGGITALLGANGAGKTTVLRAVCGMVRASGSVRFKDENICGLSTEDIARLRVAHVPEGRGTFLNLTVEENLRIGSHIRPDAKQVRTSLERVFAYFPRLKERVRQQAGTLSGGEQQMLAIARALMLGPRLILLDEPSFGLAPLVVAEIFEIMRKINREEGVSVLLVEQNARQALSLADQAYVLEIGKVVIAGPASAIAEDPRVREIYLGY